MNIHVIDLFAGPGGLGEGFSAYRDIRGRRPFRIAMSVEKEASAHATLLLRSFLRKFEREEWPPEYHRLRAGEISREQLFDAWPEQHGAALEDVLHGPRELGKDDRLIDQRLKEVTGQKSVDEPWVVIGGPPCQAYSLVGRARNRGKLDYRPEDDERNFLYREYLRVLAIARPAVFIMENVRGMLSAKVGGVQVFNAILEDLRRPGRAVRWRDSLDLEYRIHSLVVEGEDLEPSDYLIKAEDHGVPQARHRVILLGVRSDIGRPPGLLTRAEGTVPVRSVLKGLPRLRSRVSRGGDSGSRWKQVVLEGLDRVVRFSSAPRPVVDEMRQWAARLDASLPIHVSRYPEGRPVISGTLPQELKRWITGNSGAVLTGHMARAHMPSDLHRYFYAACWALCNDDASPKTRDFPVVLAPDHANWNSGKFADRFRVQSWGAPASTITSHMSKDGHYYIHPDPSQCRSLTPREAARLQTFPDDYFFEGNRTQQYVQIGNAVPPWLALQIAKVVHQLLV